MTISPPSAALSTRLNTLSDVLSLLAGSNLAVSLCAAVRGKYSIFVFEQAIRYSMHCDRSAVVAAGGNTSLDLTLELYTSAFDAQPSPSTHVWERSGDMRATALICTHRQCAGAPGGGVFERLLSSPSLGRQAGSRSIRPRPFTPSADCCFVGRSHGQSPPSSQKDG